MNMESKLIIKDENELKKHFEEHEKYNQSLMDKMMDTKFDERVDSEEYQKLSNEYDKTNISFGEWGIFYDKIEMYWSHEGSVLSNVRFCPFCGIELVLKKN